MSLDKNSKILASDITTIKTTADNALPKTGGTLSGNLIFSMDGDTVLCKTTFNNRFIIRGGESNFEDGASLYLHGKEHSDYPGEVHIYAHNGTNYANLKLTPDGKVYIKSNEVITSAGGNVSKLLSTGELALTRTVENSRIWISGGTDYIGGAVILYGSEHADYPSEARLKAGSTQLRVKSDGSCIVANKNIVRSVNGSLADASGNVSITVASLLNIQDTATPIIGNVIDSKWGPNSGDYTLPNNFLGRIEYSINESTTFKILIDGRVILENISGASYTIDTIILKKGTVLKFGLQTENTNRYWTIKLDGILF